MRCVPQAGDSPLSMRRRAPRAFFGIGVYRPTIALVAFLKGKATPSESPQTTVLPKRLQDEAHSLRVASDCGAEAKVCLEWRRLRVPTPTPPLLPRSSAS